MNLRPRDRRPLPLPLSIEAAHRRKSHMYDAMVILGIVLTVLAISAGVIALSWLFR